MPILPMISAYHSMLVNMRTKTREIVIRLIMTSSIAQCPNCQQWSSYVHSHYVRHLLDLPWGGASVHVEMQVRRFRCITPDCSHQYFTERVSEIALPYRRCTNRFQEWLSTLALAFGGEPTARALGNLGLQVSGDSCLRLIRDTPCDTAATPRVLGVETGRSARDGLMARSYATWNDIV